MNYRKFPKQLLDYNGFIDVPKIIKAKKETKLFPGLNYFVHKLRTNEFPFLDYSRRIYLDSTATSQEPLSVINKIYKYRTNYVRGSNHSKNSKEARRVQEAYEESKRKLTDFFCATDYQIGFTSGTTGSSNLIATRFPFKKGDLLLITEMEHNSQILTARNFAKMQGATVKYIPISYPDGRLDLDYLKKVVDSWKTGKILLNLVHVSNVSGVINPIKKIRNILGADSYIYLDMAQSAGHMPINLNKLAVDFAGVSAHKMYGPMGIGAFLVNKKSEKFIDNKLIGGGAVQLVSKCDYLPSTTPERLEDGTQNLEGAIEWGYSIDFLNNIGMDVIEAHDVALGKFFLKELQKIQGVIIYGPKKFSNRSAVITFNIGSIFSYDALARELDKKGVSVRDGCFCAHIYGAKLLGRSKETERIIKLMKAGKVKEAGKLPGAVRASFAFYNTLEEAYKTVCVIKKIAQKYTR